MNNRGLWVATIAGAALYFGFAGSNHDATAPAPDTPISKLEFQQFDTDSFLITFDTTVAVKNATLHTRDTSLPSPSDEQAGVLSYWDPHSFPISMRDWFSTNAGGYIVVRIYYRGSGEQQYSWSQFFTPKG